MKQITVLTYAYLYLSFIGVWPLQRRCWGLLDQDYYQIIKFIIEFFNITITQIITINKNPCHKYRLVKTANNYPLFYSILVATPGMLEELARYLPLVKQSKKKVIYPRSLEMALQSTYDDLFYEAK